MPVIATTTRYVKGEPVAEVRRGLALRTFEAASSHGHQVVVVDAGSDRSFTLAAEALGAIVVTQVQPGMGRARRQALSAAASLRTSEDEFVVWLEPEKCTLVPLLADALHDRSPTAEMVCFWRASLDSYPVEQQFAYGFGRVLADRMLGDAVDLFFGPVAIRRAALKLFLEYNGRYGDYWDSVHIPKLRALLTRPWEQQTIAYRHPPEQTAAESQDLDYLAKRPEQAHELTLAYLDEFRLMTES